MTRTATALTLQEIANIALAVLASDGVAEAAMASTGGPGWRRGVTGANGTPFDIGLAGPDIPHHLDEEVISPPLVPEQMDWTGTYRLVIRAPLIVFDISWIRGEPLRIMSFSRGDWESDLIRFAG